MKKLRLHYVSFLLLRMIFLSCENVNAQEPDFSGELRDKNTLRVCFYNLENLFDTENDSTTADDSFTPEGDHYWTSYRFRHKIYNLSKTFIAIGGWEAPELIGVCEVENASVIYRLLNFTPLKKFHYRYIHYDSPDDRGIDVAFIYRRDKFKVCYACPLCVVDSLDNPLYTRDILYVKGILPHNRKDTLHLYINHWPSRYGSYKETEEKRICAAKVLQFHIDSILNIYADAAIIVMGDFNDTPSDKSVKTYLHTNTNPDKLTTDQLLNTMYSYLLNSNTGTHKYHEHWNIFDQIMVSYSMSQSVTSWSICSTAVIFNPLFLLQADAKYLGLKPYRTFSGLKYQGGFSDHLPVYIDIFCH